MFFLSMLSSGKASWMRKTTLGERSHNRLLKILHIDPERNWGGGEVQVLGLLTYLCRRGHRNDLLTHPGGRLFEQSGPVGVKRLSLVARNDLDLRPVPALRRLIRSEKYEIGRASCRKECRSRGSP